jgi:hypothetical protein
MQLERLDYHAVEEGDWAADKEGQRFSQNRVKAKRVKQTQWIADWTVLKCHQQKEWWTRGKIGNSE